MNLAGDEPVHGTEWVLTLADWKRNDAIVTIHLRGGGTLGPGRVDRLPSAGLDAAQLAGKTDDHRAVKWTFDLREVAAITAEARW